MLDQHRLLISLVGIIVIELEEVMQSFNAYGC